MSSKVLKADRLTGIKRMKVSDFPNAGARTDFGVRNALVKGFNYCRQHPQAMRHLQGVLTTTLQRIAQWEQECNDLERELMSQGKVLPGTSQNKPLISTESAPFQERVVEPVTLELPASPATQVNNGLELPVGLPSMTGHPLQPQTFAQPQVPPLTLPPLAQV